MKTRRARTLLALALATAGAFLSGLAGGRAVAQDRQPAPKDPGPAPSAPKPAQPVPSRPDDPKPQKPPQKDPRREAEPPSQTKPDGGQNRR